MKKRTATAALTLMMAFVLFLGSCGDPVAAPEPDPTADPTAAPTASPPPTPAPTPEPSAAPAGESEISERRISERTERPGEGDAYRATVEISLPEVASEDYPENARMISDFYQNLGAGEAEDFLAYASELFDGPGEAEGSAMLSNLYCDMTFSVEYNAENYLSVLLETISYTGGAHAGIDWRADTFDMAEGVRVTLEDLFAADEAAYMQVICETVAAAIGKTEGTDAFLYYENYETLVRDTFQVENFFLTPEGLGVFYEVYDLGPFVAGPQRFVVPWDVLRELLAPSARFGE